MPTPLQSFFSELQAISDGSDFFSFPSAPRLVDISQWRVISIIAGYGPDINGNKVGTFQILYQELKKKWNRVIQFPRPDINSNATMAALYAWFQTNVANIQWSYYTQLICIDKINVLNPNISGAYTDLILNDTVVMRREFDPLWVQPNSSVENPVTTPATHLYVYQGNENDYKVYTVLGDQTLAGAQYYSLY